MFAKGFRIGGVLKVWYVCLFRFLSPVLSSGFGAAAFRKSDPDADPASAGGSARRQSRIVRRQHPGDPIPPARQCPGDRDASRTNSPTAGLGPERRGRRRFPYRKKKKHLAVLGEGSCCRFKPEDLIFVYPSNWGKGPGGVCPAGLVAAKAEK